MNSNIRLASFNSHFCCYSYTIQYIFFSQLLLELLAHGFDCVARIWKHRTMYAPCVERRLGVWVLSFVCTRNDNTNQLICWVCIGRQDNSNNNKTTSNSMESECLQILKYKFVDFLSNVTNHVSILFAFNVHTLLKLDFNCICLCRRTSLS